MLFNTLEFTLFFFVVYGLYLVLPHRGQNIMLLAASYYFYGSWDWRFLSLLILSTGVDYLAGRFIYTAQTTGRKRIFLLASICFNLGLLGVFKYYDFFARSFQEAAAAFGWQVTPILLKVVLPIGISFYTFQSMSYVIDVYRRRMPAVRNAADFALYVSFFPQLVAGPIERATHLLPQMTGRRVVTFEGFCQGCHYFLWGLFLKAVVADNLADIVDPVFNQHAGWQGGTVLLATYAFAFQIFGDFAGYSAMAIGLGKMFGVEIMENFHAPYLARDIAAFWRRWHISLSFWIRDYLYIPLGGSHRGKVRNALNILITFVLCGLWHGAGWNFVLFGLLHGTAVLVHRTIQGTYRLLPSLLQVVVTFHVVCLGWLFFRAQSAGQAWGMLRALFRNFGPLDQTFANTGYNIVLFASLPILHQGYEVFRNKPLLLPELPWLLRHSLGIVLVLSIFLLGQFGERAFIYFQF